MAANARPLVHLAVVALAIAGLGGTCTPVPPPVDPNPPGPVDGGEPLPPQPELTACGRACGRMALLKCPGYEGSPQGATCEQVCENQESSGVSSFCPNHIAEIQGRAGPGGGRECDEAELQEAFEACE